MTRVAYVLTQDRGGPVDVTLTLAKTMIDAGEHDVRVFGPAPAGQEGMLEGHFTRVAVPRKTDVAAGRRLRAMLRSWRPDVVHAQDRRSALVVAGLGGFGGPAVVVQTYHGVPYDISEQWFSGTAGARPPSFYSRAVLAADAVVARRLNRMIVPSSAMSEFLQSRLRVPGPKLVHIDNGIDLPRPTPHSGSVRHLIFIGNLYPVKGLLDLLNALGRPGVMPLDATLDVFGDGPVRAEAEEFAQRPPLAGRVRFHGFRPGAAEHIADYDALVLSSRIEQQPLVVAQAMGAGRPVLATRVGGVQEMLEVPGVPQYLAPPGDIDALAAELVRLFANPQPADLGTKLAAHATQRFSAGASAAAHSKLYDSLLRCGSDVDI
jgi:glycosyltransferase involved in cell wall biosynthesis